jgi:YD repeat-containing protein
MQSIDYNRCACKWVGTSLNEETRQCELDKWLPDQTCTVGHPVSPATGAKVKEQIDYTGAGAAPLSFIRSYNSDPRMGWTHNWAKRLDLFGHPFVIWAYRGSSSRMAFTDPDSAGTADAYQPVLPSRDRLSNTLDANGNISGWTLNVFEDDSREHYDADGRLLSVEMRNGWRYTLTYKGGQLDKVTNPFGRSLGFRYNADGRMSRLVDPAGGEIAYGYDDRGNPNRVTWQDKKFRRYHYEDKRFPELLTGITDEADVRVETYSYDDQRRVKETSLAGGVDRLTFEYGGIAGSSPQTVVTQYTEAGSTSSTYRFTRPASGLAWAPSSITAPCSLCGNTQANTTYDGAGRVFKAVAHDDTPTFYQYDETGRETERATFPASFQNAATRPALEEATRVVSTRWHATWNLPREVAEPNKITEYGYDGRGNLKREAWSATTDATGTATFDATKIGGSYAAEYDYNKKNLLTTIVEKIDNKLTAKTTYLIDSKRGEATRATNELTGESAEAVAYDDHGRLREEIDPYGVIKRNYAARGFIETEGDAQNLTLVKHNINGLLDRVETATGLVFEWFYNDVHQVKRIELNGSQLYPSSTAASAETSTHTLSGRLGIDQTAAISPLPQGLGLRGGGWLGVALTVAWEVGKRIRESSQQAEQPDEKKEDCDPCEDPNTQLQWTPHGNKHFPPPRVPWDRIVASTANGSRAYYHPAVTPSHAAQAAFEIAAWQSGTTSKIRKGYRYRKFEGRVIGASNGKETSYVRVECTSPGVVHGHPVPVEEYKRHTGGS